MYYVLFSRTNNPIPYDVEIELSTQYEGLDGRGAFLNFGKSRKPFASLERAASHMYSRDNKNKTMCLVRIVEQDVPVKVRRLSEHEELSVRLMHTCRFETFSTKFVTPFLKGIWNNKRPVYFSLVCDKGGVHRKLMMDTIRAAYGSRVKLRRCGVYTAMTVKNPDTLMNLMLLASPHLASGFESVWCYDPVGVTMTELTVDEFMATSILDYESLGAL